MPASTLWLKIGETDVRVFKQKVGNKIVVNEPTILTRMEDKPVRSERTVSKCHWEHVGTGEVLSVETTLKDGKGVAIPPAEAVCVLEHFKSLVLNEKSETVDKKKTQYFVMNPDGSVGDEVTPFPPTDRIEIKEGDWIPSTTIEQFLIKEEYELPAADPHNDIKLYKEAEKASKKDEIAITVYSNGGFTQRILSKAYT